MGKQGAKMVAREPAAHITMADIAEWVQSIRAEHGADVVIALHMAGSDELAHWIFTVKTWQGVYKPDDEPVMEQSLVWPTSSHKTVLGALMWLLVTIDDGLTASAALSDLASAGI